MPVIELQLEPKPDANVDDNCIARRKREILHNSNYIN